MIEHFVILGAGQAGGQAAATLRQKGFAGRITLLGDEPYLPYQRPPLSKKFLAGELPLERLLLRPAKFFATRDIAVLLDQHAESLDLASQRLTLADGTTLHYDKLLLAVGSRVRKLKLPGHDLAGIHYLRNVADVLRIRDSLRPGNRLTLIGGGYIGLEVAAIAAQSGLQVTVVETLDRVMARTVSPAVSEVFQRRHEAAGVTMLLNASVTRFSGNDRVRAVHTDSGDELPCDLVIAGIGVEPETALAREAGLVCENGIKVDELCRTSDGKVFAAGDCTNHPNALIGRRVRLESVPNAVEQSKVAARNMLGESLTYNELPWFWSEQYDLKLQIAGIAGADHEQVVRGVPGDGPFAVFYLAEGHMMAAEAVNRPRAFMAAKKLITAAAAITGDVLSATGRPMTEIAEQALAART